MRVALLSYRGKQHCGGQGVYIRHLSRELVALGHYVEVIAGPPYPVVDSGVQLVRVPALDLYAEPNPFRTPSLAELRRVPDWIEFMGMRSGRFTEPLAFSLRVRHYLASRDFDIVHDNQSLGYGLLGLGLSLLATVHHPVTIDSGLKPGSERWYSFTRMQSRVARRLPLIITVSSASRDEIVSRMGVRASKVRVTPLSADTSFRPGKPVPGRIVCVASSHDPIKGLGYLLAAFKEIRRDCELIVVGRSEPAPGVTFVTNLPDEEYASLIASAEVVCVPSLFEGFSLPAAEAMACGVPIVATLGGALPEVIGDAGVFVPPGDSAALARALVDLLDDPALRARLGQRGIARAGRLSWRRTAEETVHCYRELLSC
ncbi:glycosyltransferase family 4 protein [Kibdelosporangium aridum]|uniref:Glycosyltransferase involved in cell wall bisynthesis n=1 Tax=Kibdelosporangium aridum TaxID=2030 RepID=A0A1W2EAJ1_KIBAR|nr:glycosyltransferase family 4 protein [Kibdelosporangium aridum]SMD06346.1 Glycosyltransferase involved in cell wall bisynthesis [Kibdelosporangium aridum]